MAKNWTLLRQEAEELTDLLETGKCSLSRIQRYALADELRALFGMVRPHAGAVAKALDGRGDEDFSPEGIPGDRA